MIESHWLDRNAAAAYISVRVDEIARLERGGKLPKASYHLGPRKPRWDRMALDAVFAGTVSSTDPETAVAALVEKMYQRGPHRAKAPGGRNSRANAVQQPPIAP